MPYTSKLLTTAALAHILFGYDESLEMFGSCPYGNRQCASDGLQGSVETQLAHHHIFLEMIFYDVAVGSQYADS